MKCLIIDPRLAGISGDMLLSALVDLTGNGDLLYQLTDVLKRRVDYCRDVKLEIFDVNRLGLRAKRVELRVEEDLKGITPGCFKANVERVIDEVDLSSEAINFALKVIDEIIEAEKRVHGELREMHEVASVDTIFDVIGVALLLDKANLLKAVIYALPPALGSGLIETSHGVLPVPAPATLEILRRHQYPYVNAPVSHELTTPTGAALLVSLAKEVVDFYPPMRVLGVGYGAGSRDLTGIPNVLRVVKGEIHGATIERVAVLETNVDDVNGEVIGGLFDKLFNLGALDVMIIPGIGKKNRPTNLIKVIAPLDKYNDIAEALIHELGTLGVRVIEQPRITVERHQEEVEVEVNGRKFKVKVKVSKGFNGKILRVKPEYDDLKRISDELKMPLRRVMELVLSKIGGYDGG